MSVWKYVIVGCVVVFLIMVMKKLLKVYQVYKCGMVFCGEELKGKIVIIIGVNCGIGRVMVLELVKR